MFVGFHNVSTSSMRGRHTHGQTGEKKNHPSNSTTETKWRLWEPSYVYSISLLYFSFSRFEDCCNVRGGFNVVLPSGHYFPVCHAEERGEQRTESRREQQWADEARMHMHKLLGVHVHCSIDSNKKWHLMHLHFAFLDFYCSDRNLFIPADIGLPESTLCYLLAISASKQGM